MHGQCVLLGREIVRLCVSRQVNVCGALTGLEQRIAEKVIRVDDKSSQDAQYEQYGADRARQACEMVLALIGQLYRHAK